MLLDIGLPGMDGLDALHELKARYEMPVIFLTARRRELDEVVGLELGADDYITKPFDVDVLLAHIKAVLRRYADRRRPRNPSARRRRRPADRPWRPHRSAPRPPAGPLAARVRPAATPSLPRPAR